MDIPTTTIPRIGTTFEASFAPFADDNDVDFEVELNINLFGTEQTGGWVSSHFDIVDETTRPRPLTRRGRPRTSSESNGTLRSTCSAACPRVTGCGTWRPISLDYLATGLPKAGNLIGGERFLDDASPWSLSFVMVIPLAPLAP